MNLHPAESVTASRANAEAPIQGPPHPPPARRLRQPGRTDTRRITISATCPAGQAPFHTGGGLCVAVSAVPSGCAVTALAARTPWWGQTGASGAYSLYGSGAPAACSSLSQSSRAKYYSFTVPHDAPAEGLPARIALEPLQRPMRPGQTPPALTSGGGSPSVTLWRYVPASGPNEVQQIALTTARRGADPVLSPTLTAGRYLIEIAPTGTVSAGSFDLNVWVPTPQKAHSDVRDLGNTGLGGMTLERFLDARGSICYGEHPTCPTDNGDPFDPSSPTYPWLPFKTDRCSIPQGLVQGLESWLNAMILAHSSPFTTPELVDLAQYIRDHAAFGTQTVSFVFACMRHDFNWRNLYRVEHHLQHAGTWNTTVRAQADERFNLDLKRLCDANRGSSPVTYRHYSWQVPRDLVAKCHEVADAMKFGVSTVPMSSISYGAQDV